MATVTRTIVNEGPTKLIIQVVIEGDNAGDLVNYSLLDATLDFTPTIPVGTTLAIMQMWGSTSWFDVLFSFGGVVPTKAWVFSRDSSNYHDFRGFAGLKDLSDEDPNGQLLITTSGLDVGMVGTFVIQLKKN